MLPGFDPANAKRSALIGGSLKLRQRRLGTEMRVSRDPHRVSPKGFNVIATAFRQDVDLRAGLERFEFYAVRCFGRGGHHEPPAATECNRSATVCPSGRRMRAVPYLYMVSPL